MSGQFYYNPPYQCAICDSVAYRVEEKTTDDGPFQQFISCSNPKCENYKKCFIVARIYLTMKEDK